MEVGYAEIQASGSFTCRIFFWVKGQLRVDAETKAALRFAGTLCGNTSVSAIAQLDGGAHVLLR